MTDSAGELERLAREIEEGNLYCPDSTLQQRIVEALKAERERTARRCLEIAHIYIGEEVIKDTENHIKKEFSL